MELTKWKENRGEEGAAKSPTPTSHPSKKALQELQEEEDETPSRAEEEATPAEKTGWRFIPVSKDEVIQSNPFLCVYLGSLKPLRENGPWQYSSQKYVAVRGEAVSLSNGWRGLERCYRCSRREKSGPKFDIIKKRNRSSKIREETEELVAS